MDLVFTNGLLRQHGSRSKWCSLSDTFIQYGIGTTAFRFVGVYAIYIDGHLVYVGSTRNLAQRITHHQLSIADGVTRWGAGSVSVKFRHLKSEAVSRTLEAKLIRKLRPTFNKQVPVS